MSWSVTSCGTVTGPMAKPFTGSTSVRGATWTKTGLRLLLGDELEPELDRLQCGRRSVGGDQDSFHGSSLFASDRRPSADEPHQ